eukprot:9127312-Pyramimonas_sp.AAC.3
MGSRSEESSCFDTEATRAGRRVLQPWVFFPPLGGGRESRGSVNVRGLAKIGITRHVYMCIRTNKHACDADRAPPARSWSRGVETTLNTEYLYKP